MIRARRRFDFFLHDMVEAMDRILFYTENKSYAEFVDNTMLRDAVIRNFEILGESIKHIPFKFQRQYKQVPWQHMNAMRNFIVHEYFDVDDEILWEIIQHDLKDNRDSVKEIIQEKYL